jgi:hypothetical protein
MDEYSIFEYENDNNCGEEENKSKNKKYIEIYTN